MKTAFLLLFLAGSVFGQNGARRVPAGPSNLVTKDASGNVTIGTTVPITAPAPTVTNGGTPGATSYGYTVIATFADTTKSVSSQAVYTATGNASLSAGNYNTIATVAMAGSTSCGVYRVRGGSTHGRIADIDCGTAVNDTGLTAVTTDLPRPNAGLLIVDSKAIDDPATPIRYYRPTTADRPGDVFFVNEGGWVMVRDYLTVGPYTNGQPALGGMMTLNSDLGADGVTLAVQNNLLNHDIAWFQSIGASGWSDGTPHLIIQHSGMLNLGPKTATAPALLPSGIEVQVKKGDNSGYADTRAGVVSAETRVCLGSGTSTNRAGIAQDTSVGQTDITVCGGAGLGYGKLNSQEYHLTASGVLQWSPNTDPSNSSADVKLTRAAAGVLSVGAASGLGRIALVQSTPTTATDACTAGSIWTDADYIYVCTATGVIKRTAIAGW
jgi:hypothetical protein